MASENETVADIIAVNRAIYQGCEECSLSDKDVKWFLDLIDNIDAAYKREVDALNFKLMTAKSEQKTAANVIIEQTNKVEKLEYEVAELRELSNDMRTWFRLYYSCGSDPKSKWWRSCASCRRKRCPIHKWRKALEGAGK